MACRPQLVFQTNANPGRWLTWRKSDFAHAVAQPIRRDRVSVNRTAVDDAAATTAVGASATTGCWRRAPEPRATAAVGRSHGRRARARRRRITRRTWPGARGGSADRGRRGITPLAGRATV